jgi:hypothetical protein
VLTFEFLSCPVLFRRRLLSTSCDTDGSVAPPLLIRFASTKSLGGNTL